MGLSQGEETKGGGGWIGYLTGAGGASKKSNTNA